MRDLPSGMCRDILLRLPAESLFRLRSISKGWRTIIDDPSFVRAHARKHQSSSNTVLLRNAAGPPFDPLYLFDLEDLSVTNGPLTIPATPLKLTRAALSGLPPLPTTSCDGLLLIPPTKFNGWHCHRMFSDKKSWEIWNPLTHDRLKLPQRPNVDGRVSAYGFGYDSVSDDYKVVMIDGAEKHDRQTHVYSLRANSWRTIGNCPYDEFSNWEGVFLNGALHFVSSYPFPIIIALDLSTESYRTPKLKLPEAIAKMRIHQLDALGGCLLVSFYNSGSEQFEGWVMNCYGDEGSWVKLFSLRPDPGYCGIPDLSPLAYAKDKGLVLVQQRRHNEFLLLDVNGNSVKRVEVHGFYENFSVQAFVGSLFRLQERCGIAGDKPRTRMRKRMAKPRLTFCLRDFVTKQEYGREYFKHDNCYSSDHIAGQD